MKILEAEYAGLESPFTKVKVKVQLKSRPDPVEGVMLWENDGRDLEVEGDLEAYFDPWNDVHDEIDELFQDDESMELLSPILQQGSEEYYA